tara:strand:+ start:198 stop:389 length:192 start_codon:yes stop_codon:yes gene_type:complete
MPVYLRIFYYRELDAQHKKENEQMEKAKKGQGRTTGPPKIPSFAKPPSKPSVSRPSMPSRPSK